MKTKKLLILAAVLNYAPYVSAGSPEPLAFTAPPPVVAASNLHNWSGFYAGGLIGFTSGSHDYHNVGDPIPTLEWDIGGTSYGGFAGYNIQRNRLVFGGEVAVTTGNVQIAGGFFPDYAYDLNVDLKARAGFAVGRALIFGEVGYGIAHWGDDLAVEDTDLSGIIFGIGVDYAITDRIFVGIEYISRGLSGIDNIDPTTEIKTSQQTIQGRIGISF